MRVALLNPCFWPEVRRGGERMVRDLADGLIARGHSPRLVTSHRGSPRRTVEGGLPITRHWRPPDGFLRRRLYEDNLTHVPFSYLSLLRGDDDLAHAFYPTDALAAARWSGKTGAPSVLSYLGIPLRPYLAERRRRLQITRRAIAGCSAVTALSQAAADEFERTLGVEPRVIHPGVDLDVFSPARERAQEPTIFCAAAVGAPAKRVELLVAAFGAVRRERPGARLLLSRPRDAHTAARFERAGEGVELIDVDDRAALARAYARAWVSALPSRGEPFGLVLVESLAAGTPVVATSTGAVPEIVDSGAVGRLFDGGEAELAHALLEALDLSQDPATAAACRERAEAFSLDRCVESYERLYRELLAG